MKVLIISKLRIDLVSRANTEIMFFLLPFSQFQQYITIYTNTGDRVVQCTLNMWFWCWIGSWNQMVVGGIQGQECNVHFETCCSIRHMKLTLCRCNSVLFSPSVDQDKGSRVKQCVHSRGGESKNFTKTTSLRQRFCTESFPTFSPD